MSLWKFDYDFNRERLLHEAKEGDFYQPFTDYGNQSNEAFVGWLVENPHLKEKVFKFYENLRVHVKNADKCPYALEIAKYFTDLTGRKSWPRFYYQKKGYNRAAISENLENLEKVVFFRKVRVSLGKAMENV